MQDVTARYNLIIMEDWSQHTYDTHSGGVKAGIRLYDENGGGDNSDAVIEIYGNIIINQNRALRIWCVDNPPSSECNTFGDGLGSIKIHNNIFIDSHLGNIYIDNEEYYQNLIIPIVLHLMHLGQ